MSEQEPEPPLTWTEFNPMRFPPCECPRCREDEPRETREEGDGDAGGESVLLRQLRARVAEENALRRSMRRPE